MTETKEPRGRLYQDAEFIFDEFDELHIERIVVCQDKYTNEPIVIYIKVETRNWHQYFLDAGIGFWENWDEFDNLEEDTNFKYIDVTEQLNLRKKEISKIYCKSDHQNSKIVIELASNEQLTLQCKDPAIFDSECEFIKEVRS